MRHPLNLGHGGVSKFGQILYFDIVHQFLKSAESYLFLSISKGLQLTSILTRLINCLNLFQHILASSRLDWAGFTTFSQLFSRLLFLVTVLTAAGCQFAGENVICFRKIESHHALSYMCRHFELTFMCIPYTFASNDLNCFKNSFEKDKLSSQYLLLPHFVIDFMYLNF